MIQKGLSEPWDANIRMPMQLPQPSRLQRYHCCGNRGRDGEIPRIDHGKSAASSGDLLRGQLREMVHKGTVALHLAAGARNNRGADVHGGCDVGVRFGKVREDGFVDIKILGQDRFGSVHKPVIDHVGCSAAVS